MLKSMNGKSSSKGKMSYTKSKIEQFQRTVWNYYRLDGRHELPWRITHNPYKILVSEVMLQQTQVDRVRPYYKALLAQFPTVHDLAAAPLGDVLRMWQGLGYNRRAKMLHEAAKEVVEKHGGTFPKSVEELQKLRGVGPYTARAIAAFAYNQDVVFIETNLRTAVTYHFLLQEKSIEDKEILEILSKAYPKEKGKAREWYSALMDYGSHLKRSGVRVNNKSKTYSKQSTFTGSGRQARGAILKELTKGAQAKKRLIGLFGEDRSEQLGHQLQKLISEGMVEKSGAKFALPK
jgi:A/G-specific adenine glycosylase